MPPRIEKIDNRTALIGVVGLGHVGRPLELRYVEAGYRVLVSDIDADKVQKLHRGDTYIKHIPSATIAKAQPGFEAATDFFRASEADALIPDSIPVAVLTHRAAVI